MISRGDFRSISLATTSQSRADGAATAAALT
jgi:hypothetical protein